jgi:hypothetical protein
VTHRGDVDGDIHPDHRRHGQTPERITPVPGAGRRSKARVAAAAERFRVR